MDNKSEVLTDIHTQDKPSDIEQQTVKNTLSSQQDRITDTSKYHATINKEDETITIELNGPLPPQINSPEVNVTNSKNTQTNRVSEEVSTAEDSTQSSDDKNINTTTKTIDDDALTTIKKPINNTSSSITNEVDTTIENTNQTSITEQANKNIEIKVISAKNDKTNLKSIEIIHIIVKGDTLWAIAKHYLQNPFLYPELAKLSKIKNPDLIYPGNRVIIIYRDK